MAGAVAARRLVDAGYDVTLVEARERVGGRIQTSTPDGWPIAVDSGAWALTGAGPRCGRARSTRGSPSRRSISRPSARWPPTAATSTRAPPGPTP
ncbi:FAD-dependent oxidoreductase [Rathayibacter oskolensis]|uniref:FAD-dependent oxidoreductase n=1 Tax=Rathayibacter oskolensis TaxID=1891671 RepID=UPI00265FD492|nr:FAD-dependent oxidoreductase [Rathayibacter oskolensis]WKK73173.1 FAD-dependent oxidoreductase [Rathayibacter oskolensis]